MCAGLTKFPFFPPFLDSFLCGHSGLFRVMWIRKILLISSLIPILWSNTSGHKLLAADGSRIGLDETSKPLKTSQLWNGRRRGRCKQTNQTKIKKSANQPYKKQNISKPTKQKSKKSAHQPYKKTKHQQTNQTKSEKLANQPN